MWKAGSIYYEITQMKDWVPYEAELLSSTLEEHEGMGNAPITYEVVVSYQYEVEGTSYMGDRVNFGYLGGNTGRHVQVAEKLKSAKKVRVWVNPHDPGDSALAQGWSEGAVMFLLFIFVFLSGIVGAILWNKKTLSNRLKTLSKMFFSFTFIGVALLLGRLALVSMNDDYMIKLEDKIEVIVHLDDQKIERGKLIE